MSTPTGYPRDWSTGDILRNWDVEPEELRESQRSAGKTGSRMSQIGCFASMATSLVPPAMAIFGSGRARVAGLGLTALEIIVVGGGLALASGDADTYDKVNREQEGLRQR